MKEYKLIFWDFDGVIKDSVDAKTKAFVDLFQGYGETVAARVKKHHIDNGGMSRFLKIPLYLSWAGEEASKSRVRELCERFRQLAQQRVIDAPWVPGVESYLRSNRHKQIFVLVSATPQDELEEILRELDLGICFNKVFGAPTDKKSAIHITLKSCGFGPRDCLMVGDAKSDLEAACANDIPFLLRRHPDNIHLFSDYTGDSVGDFSSI